MARSKQTARVATPQALAKRALAGLARRNAPAPETAKKTHRYRPGTVALREIRKYQKTTHFLIALAPFNRFVREISQDRSKDMRWSINAVHALQESAESFLVTLMEETNLAAIHRKRITIAPKDMDLVKKLREIVNPANAI